jgi:hypothetical protein
MAWREEEAHYTAAAAKAWTVHSAAGVVAHHTMEAVAAAGFGEAEAAAAHDA